MQAGNEALRTPLVSAIEAVALLAERDAYRVGGWATYVLLAPVMRSSAEG